MKIVNKTSRYTKIIFGVVTVCIAFNIYKKRSYLITAGLCQNYLVDRFCFRSSQFVLAKKIIFGKTK